MKKLLVVVLALFVSVYANAKNKREWWFEIGTGGGMSRVSGLNTGVFCISASIYDFYFEVATNFARGDGEYLDFSSSESYRLDKVCVTSIIAGWNINLFKNKLILLPKIGYTESSAIYNDPIAWDTWYKSKLKGKLYLGGAVKWFFHKNIGIGIHSALTMPIAAQLHFHF